MAKDNKQPDKMTQTNGGTTTMAQSATDPKVMSRRSWNDQAEAYLIERGWEKVSEDETTGLSLWSDPNGSLARGSFSQVIELPTREGGIDRFRQFKGPPSPWNYNLREAYVIQKGRDAENPDLMTPQQKLNKLEILFDNLVKGTSSSIAQLEGILKRVPPSKGDPSALGEIKEMRKLINEISRNLQKGLPSGVRQSELIK